MNAYWLTYKTFHENNAPLGWSIEELSALVKRFENDPTNTTESWRISSHKKACIGDRVYLFKQGNEPRGIFGVGKIVSLPQLKESFSKNGRFDWQCDVSFEKLVDPTKTFLLLLSQISDFLPKTLINTQQSGDGVDEEFSIEIEKRLKPWLMPPLNSDQADDLIVDPGSVGDQRMRTLRGIYLRRGQTKFRSALINAYEGRCVITRCKITDILEAAHITPYMGEQTNTVNNGLLLRADLHTLFDCYLLSINPDTRQVIVAKNLEESSYNQFSGKLLLNPKDSLNSPAKKYLQERFERFKSQQKKLLN